MCPKMKEGERRLEHIVHSETLSLLTFPCQSRGLFRIPELLGFVYDRGPLRYTNSIDVGFALPLARVLPTITLVSFLASALPVSPDLDLNSMIF